MYIVGCNGKIVFDGTKPDGVRRKMLDIGLFINIALSAKTDLEEGLLKTYEAFKLVR